MSKEESDYKEIITAADLILASLPKKDKFGNKIDASSEHFCYCPECKDAYMRGTLQQSFCSVSCKDRFHNRKKRREKTAKEVELEKTEVIIEEDQRLQNIKHCIEIIEALKPTREGITIHPDYFSRHKFRFDAYEGRYPMDSMKESFYLTFGNYHLSWWTFDQIIIQNHKPNNIIQNQNHELK